MERSAHFGHLHLTVSSLQETDAMTKRELISDTAKTFDLLGWFSPSTIVAKILLQRVWEAKIVLDDVLPPNIHQSCLKWKTELPLLTERHILRRATFVDGEAHSPLSLPQMCQRR